MLVGIGIAIIILYLLSMPLRVKIKGFLDFAAGQGEVSFLLFYITIFKLKGLTEHFSFFSSDFIILQKKKKKKVHVEMKKQTFEKAITVIRNMDLSFLSNLDVRDVHLSLHYGQSDAFLTAIVLASVKILFYSVMAAIKSNQHVEINEEFVPEYNFRKFKMDFHGIFSLSIADIIYGYTAGKIKSFKKRLPKKTAAKKELDKELV